MTYGGEFISSFPPKMLTMHCDMVERSIISRVQVQVLRRFLNIVHTNTTTSIMITISI